MPVCTLPYEGKCELRLVVDIHGTKKEVNVLVDSGFTSMTGFGLKLPVEFVEYADYTGTGHVTVADGTLVAASSIPDAKIIQVGEHQLRDGVRISTLFMGGGLSGCCFSNTAFCGSMVRKEKQPLNSGNPL